MAKTGRPTKYDPKMNGLITGMCLLGATDEKIADALKIDIATFYRWKDKHEDFCDAILRGKDQADAKIASSMYHRAAGYKHRATKVFYDSKAAEAEYESYNKAVRKWEDDGMTGLMPEPPSEDAGVVKVDYIERYPPDTAAAKFILTNRHPDTWKDKQEITNKGESKVVHSIEWEPSANCDPIVDKTEPDDITP